MLAVVPEEREEHTEGAIFLMLFTRKKLRHTHKQTILFDRFEHAETNGEN